MQDISEILDGYTEDQLIEMLRVKRQTARNWRSSGTGPPYFRAGNQFIYPKAGLRQWTEQRTVYPAPLAPTLASAAPRRPGRPRKTPLVAA